MKVGDKVTGVPCNERMRDEFPTLTGRYDFEDWETTPGKTARTEFVVVGGAEVDCEDIRPAGRRDKETEAWV